MRRCWVVLFCVVWLRCHRAGSTGGSTLCDRLFDCRTSMKSPPFTLVYRMTCKPEMKLTSQERSLDLVRVPIDSTVLPRGVTYLDISCKSADGYSYNSVPLGITIADTPQLRYIGIRDVKLKEVDPGSSGNLSVFSGDLRNLNTLTMSGLQSDIWPNLFNNLFSLKQLHILDSNYINSLNKSQFSELHSLEELKLDSIGSQFSKLPFKQIENSISDLTDHCNTLKKLHLNDVFKQKNNLNINNFFPSANFNITEISFDSNIFNTIEGDLTRLLPNLKSLSLMNAQLNHQIQISDFFRQIQKHKTLEYINFSNQKSIDIPEKKVILTNCDGNQYNISLYNNIRSININGMVIWNFALNRICLNNNNTNLRYIDMSSVKFINEIYIGCELESLEFLSLQNTNLNFEYQSVFSKLTNIKILLLGNTRIGKFIDSKPIRLFENNVNLELLDLSACDLKSRFPGEMLSELRNLKVLNMSNNPELRYINEIDFTKSPRIELLNLSNCDIRQLSENTMKQFENIANFTLDISGNQNIVCTPAFVSWIEYLTVGRNSLFYDIKHVSCVYPNGTRVFIEKMATKRKTIQNTKVWIKILIAIAACVLILILTAVFIWKRYKWTFALYLYNRKKKYRNKKMEPLSMQRVFAYDTYICYSKGDRDWVLQTLEPKLTTSGLRTLIHERDYLPGAIIENAIQESIDNSRWTILVITKHFLASKWCMRELQLASVENSRRKINQDVDKLIFDDLIIPIVLDEKTTCLEDIAEAGILHQSFLKWPQVESFWTRGLDDKMTLFWDKLITKLKSGGNLKRKS